MNKDLYIFYEIISHVLQISITSVYALQISNELKKIRS